jgi:hypothetical protein
VPEAATGVALNTIEVRYTGGMLALNRLLMTLQNKRMPVAGFTLGGDSDGMRATILLGCPPESALRYTAIICALEDVREARPAGTGARLRSNRVSKRMRTMVPSWRLASPRRLTPFSPLLATVWKTWFGLVLWPVRRQGEESRWHGYTVREI